MPFRVYSFLRVNARDARCWWTRFEFFSHNNNLFIDTKYRSSTSWLNIETCCLLPKVPLVCHNLPLTPTFDVSRSHPWRVQTSMLYWPLLAKSLLTWRRATTMPSMMTLTRRPRTCLCWWTTPRNIPPPWSPISHSGSLPRSGLRSHMACWEGIRAPSQFKDYLSRYGDSHVKDKTVIRPSYL